MSPRNRKSGGRQFDAAFDITPMIDVVLLLLIFFIVTARMEPSVVAELPKAKHGEVASGEEGIVINVKHGADGNAQILRADGTAFSRDREQMSVEITEYVRHGLETASRQFVLIRSDPKVKNKEIFQIREASSAALEENQQILIAVQQ